MTKNIMANILQRKYFGYLIYNIILKSSEETDGKYIFIEGYFKPNSRIPLHLHKHRRILSCSEWKSRGSIWK